MNKDLEGKPEPIASATVILVTASARGSYRTFLMRRHRGQAFKGGAYVFPGGRLDEQDCDPRLASCTRALSAAEARQRLQEPELPDDMALGLFFAAVRETFEEAGVLFASDRSGRLVSFSEGETAGRFAAYRLQLHEKTISLNEIASREKILFALDLMTPYAHWITPEIERKRFSTRFLLAIHPEGQLPFHDTIEMTKSLWISPAEALEQHRAGEILLMPPTLKTLEELNAFQSVDELFARAASRKIRPILPEAFRFDGGFGVKLPYDPEYTIQEYKRPPLQGEPSRIVMRDGLWRTERADQGEE